jgi:hypothetical protein
MISYSDYINIIACDLFNCIDSDVKNTFIQSDRPNDLFLAKFPIDYARLTCITKNKAFTEHNMKTCISYNDLVENVDYRIKIELKCLLSRNPYYVNNYYLTIDAFLRCVTNAKYSKFKNLIPFVKNRQLFYNDYIEQYSKKIGIVKLIKDPEMSDIMNGIIDICMEYPIDFPYVCDYDL